MSKILKFNIDAHYNESYLILLIANLLQLNVIQFALIYILPRIKSTSYLNLWYSREGALWRMHIFGDFEQSKTGLVTK